MFECVVSSRSTKELEREKVRMDEASGFLGNWLTANSALCQRVWVSAGAGGAGERGC